MLKYRLFISLFSVLMLAACYSSPETTKIANTHQRNSIIWNDAHTRHLKFHNSTRWIIEKTYNSIGAVDSASYLFNAAGYLEEYLSSDYWIDCKYDEVQQLSEITGNIYFENREAIEITFGHGSGLYLPIQISNDSYYLNLMEHFPQLLPNVSSITLKKAHYLYKANVVVSKNEGLFISSTTNKGISSYDTVQFTYSDSLVTQFTRHYSLRNRSEQTSFTYYPENKSIKSIATIYYYSSTPHEIISSNKLMFNNDYFNTPSQEQIMTNNNNYTFEYKYDAHSNQINAPSLYWGGEAFEYCLTIDSHNNWTKRAWKEIVSGNQPITEERTIEYFE